MKKKKKINSRFLLLFEKIKMHQKFLQIMQTHKIKKNISILRDQFALIRSKHTYTYNLASELIVQAKLLKLNFLQIFEIIVKFFSIKKLKFYIIISDGY